LVGFQLDGFDDIATGIRHRMDLDLQHQLLLQVPCCN
jgi:hypothetical protein